MKKQKKKSAQRWKNSAVYSRILELRPHDGDVVTDQVTGVLSDRGITRTRAGCTVKAVHRLICNMNTLTGIITNVGQLFTKSIYYKVQVV